MNRRIVVIGGGVLLLVILFGAVFLLGRCSSGTNRERMASPMTTQEVTLAQATPEAMATPTPDPCVGLTGRQLALCQARNRPVGAMGPTPIPTVTPRPTQGPIQIYGFESNGGEAETEEDFWRKPSGDFLEGFGYGLCLGGILLIVALVVILTIVIRSISRMRWW